ncbi:MAG: hypothetical protein RSB54_02485 [Bacilli bacterium]
MTEEMLNSLDNQIDLYVKGIFSQKVFDVAKKMDVNLSKLCFNMIIDDHYRARFESVLSMILGIYGNCLATCYFEGLGYKTNNEVPIFDEDGNEITKSDVSFTDKNGVLNLCEVKTISQILANLDNYKKTVIKNYYDREDYIFANSDNNKIKFELVSKKLIKQVKCLKQNKNAIVNVIIFKNCYLDDDTINELKSLKVRIITLSIDINELINSLSETLSKICNYGVELKLFYENIYQESIINHNKLSA